VYCFCLLTEYTKADNSYSCTVTYNNWWVTISLRQTEENAKTSWTRCTGCHLLWPAVKSSDLIYTGMRLTSAALTTISDKLKGTRPSTCMIYWAVWSITSSQKTTTLCCCIIPVLTQHKFEHATQYFLGGVKHSQQGREKLQGHCHYSWKLHTDLYRHFFYSEAKNSESLTSTGVPNLSLTMHPFSFLTNEHVPLQHFNR